MKKNVLLVNINDVYKKEIIVINPNQIEDYVRGSIAGFLSFDKRQAPNLILERQIKQKQN